MDKTEALTLNKANFDGKMILSQAIDDIPHLIHSLPNALNKIGHGIHQCTMRTDASLIKTLYKYIFVYYILYLYRVFIMCKPGWESNNFSRCFFIVWGCC